MPIAPDMVDTVQNFDVDDLLDAASGGSGGNNTIRINGTAEIVSRRELVHVDMADTYEIPVTDGYIRYGHYEGTGPAYTTQEIQRVTQDIGDSNTSIIKRSTIKQPYNTSVDAQTGKMTVSGQPKSGGLATNAAYFINAVNAAQFCVSAGVALGKGFDSYLYNANPDYWDSIGLQTLNPETWASLTSENDSLGARVFNAIFGIDSDTGNAQMYMDSDAFAYIAQCLNNAGMFRSHIPSVMDSKYLTDNYQYYYFHSYNLPMSFSYKGPYQVKIYYSLSGLRHDNNYSISTFTSNDDVYFINWIMEDGQNHGGQYSDYYTSVQSYWVSTNPNATVHFTRVNCDSNGQITFYEGYNSYNGNNYLYEGTTKSNGNSIYCGTLASISGANYYGQLPFIGNPSEYINNVIQGCADFIQLITLGNVDYGSDIEGVDTQPNASLPNTTNWTDQQSTDASLRQQYPDLYQNALKYDVPDANGNLIEKTYIPVAWPNTTANPWTDTQPTTDTSVQTQTSTLVNLLQGLQTQVDTLTKTITQPVNTTPNGTLPPAENPTDTGSGSSPVPVTPTGNASALWSVYHPTQAQVNAFGAWLWSTNFIDQIMKMFQNPMEGIISLHKVFATPIDAGTGNIIVGTLDSGVASATVTQQYVYVSCGSVDCHEDFGNVFDYSPHTQVSLYLPFIGIVPLDVSDVMRSTITVDYGVDMFTGACLAMVKVSRDNDTVNMYQYAGSASVEYPLSNVQQSQLLSGILAVAAGGAAIATGGMSIPAGAAVAGGLANTMKSNVGRSGGFSGNAGAMGIKKPYLIIQRPQTKVASLFPVLSGYPTNISGQLSDFSGQVKVTDVHVEGIPATDVELIQIEELLHSGVLV